MTKQEILQWFNNVCAGIRAEYEGGASIRDYNVDEKDLSRMLDSFSYTEKLKSALILYE